MFMFQFIKPPFKGLIVGSFREVFDSLVEVCFCLIRISYEHLNVFETGNIYKLPTQTATLPTLKIYSSNPKRYSCLGVEVLGV